MWPNKNAIPSYTWAGKPTAASVPPNTEVFFTNLCDRIVKGFSDGVSKWIIQHSLNLKAKSKGWLVPSLAAANAATYSQTGTTITITSTGHNIPATSLNGFDVYLAFGSGAAVTGWFTNFNRVDANTFTCTSSVSQSTSGVVNTNIAETTITELTSTIRGGLPGANGSLLWRFFKSHNNSAGTKAVLLKFGGSTVYAPTADSTSVGAAHMKWLSNANSETKQVIHTTSAINSAAVTISMTNLAVDTTVDQDFTVSLTCSAANDYTAIHSYQLDLTRSF